jgi:hypothetical protein
MATEMELIAFGEIVDGAKIVDQPIFSVLGLPFWPKNQSICHFDPVFVAEVAVDFSDQDASVLVAHPAGDGHVVDARHDGTADEQMSKVVESLEGDAGLSAGQPEAFPEGQGASAGAPPPG